MKKRPRPLLWNKWGWQVSFNVIEKNVCDDREKKTKQKNTQNNGEKQTWWEKDTICTITGMELFSGYFMCTPEHVIVYLSTFLSLCLSLYICHIIFTKGLKIATPTILMHMQPYALRHIFMYGFYVQGAVSIRKTVLPGMAIPM